MAGCADSSLSRNDAGGDFERIYSAFRPRILRYLTGLVGEFEAEDLTQEVCIRIHQALPNFRGEAKLETWIYRIATNAALDRLRQPSFKREVPAAPLTEPAAEETEFEDRDLWTGEPPPSFEQQVFRKEGFECYCDFLAGLPEKYRLVVILNQLGEYTTREIADLLGLNQDVVKIRLHRGKAQLLRELKAHCKPEDWL